GQLGIGGQTGGTGGGVLSGGSTGSAGSAGSAGTTGSAGQGGVSGQRPISFGTLLDAQSVMVSAQQLAKSPASPSSAQWQAKGDQHRKNHFAAANTDEPYRLYVPTNWDGKANLPLLMFLHGSGNDENAYADQ